ncbi:unnamed protein product, partial [marine sediment metagenome]
MMKTKDLERAEGDLDEEPNFKIWIAGAPTAYGGIDYYLVPQGVLEEGYDDVGDYVNRAE